MVKIDVGVTEATFAIIGVLGSNGFYEKFDKKVYELQSRPQISNDTYVKESCKIVRFIRSHWNRKNDKHLEEVFSKHEDYFKAFLEAKEEFNDGNGCAFKEIASKINAVVKVVGCKGIQNTKISKILHVLAPKLIPMIDPEQGRFILQGNYRGKETDDLIKVFDLFHAVFKENKNEINAISNKLNDDFNCKITKIRIFELLIWLQTQCGKKEKEFKVRLINQGG